MIYGPFNTEEYAKGFCEGIASANSQLKHNDNYNEEHSMTVVGAPYLAPATDLQFVRMVGASQQCAEYAEVKVDKWFVEVRICDPSSFGH